MRLASNTHSHPGYGTADDAGQVGGGGGEDGLLFSPMLLDDDDNNNNNNNNNSDSPDNENEEDRRQSVDNSYQISSSSLLEYVGFQVLPTNRDRQIFRWLHYTIGLLFFYHLIASNTSLAVASDTGHPLDEEYYVYARRDRDDPNPNRPDPIRLDVQYFDMEWNTSLLVLMGIFLLIESYYLYQAAKLVDQEDQQQQMQQQLNPTSNASDTDNAVRRLLRKLDAMLHEPGQQVTTMSVSASNLTKVSFLTNMMYLVTCLSLIGSILLIVLAMFLATTRTTISSDCFSHQYFTPRNYQNHNIEDSYKLAVNEARKNYNSKSSSSSGAGAGSAGTTANWDYGWNYAWNDRYGYSYGGNCHSRRGSDHAFVSRLSVIVGLYSLLCTTGLGVYVAFFLTSFDPSSFLSSSSSNTSSSASSRTLPSGIALLTIGVVIFIFLLILQATREDVGWAIGIGLVITSILAGILTSSSTTTRNNNTTRARGAPGPYGIAAMRASAASIVLLLLFIFPIRRRGEEWFLVGSIALACSFIPSAIACSAGFIVPTSVANEYIPWAMSTSIIIWTISSIIWVPALVPILLIIIIIIGAMIIPNYCILQHLGLIMIGTTPLVFLFGILCQAFGTEIPLLVITPIYFVSGFVACGLGGIVTKIRPRFVYYGMSFVRRVLPKIMTSCVTFCNSVLQDLNNAVDDNATSNAAANTGANDTEMERLVVAGGGTGSV